MFTSALQKSFRGHMTPDASGGRYHRGVHFTITRKVVQISLWMTTGWR